MDFNEHGVRMSNDSLVIVLKVKDLLTRLKTIKRLAK